MLWLGYIRDYNTLLYGGFLKRWYPTTMGFPTKIDHFGVFLGYHHLRKHPYGDCMGLFIGVSKNRGTPKWMVYNGLKTLLKWMIWGYHYFWKHPYRDCMGLYIVNH